MILASLPRTAILDPTFWKFSPSVPRLERPVRAPVAIGPADTPWRQALEAIPNKGADELSYDEWLRVVAAIHAETRGSDEGLAIAQAWSARASKNDPVFLEERVWPYLSDDRQGGVTGRTIMSIAAKSGWSPPIDTSGFAPVDETPKRRRDDDDEDMSGLGLTITAGGAVVRRATIQGDVDAAIEEVRKGVPPAEHACTDQANANRLVREFGNLLLVSAGSWYCWDGRRWERGEAELYRMACQLSRIVKSESQRAVNRAIELNAAGDTAAADRVGKLAKALDQWSAKCEMKGTLEAAVGLAKKMLEVHPATLDRNPWLLNVHNGTLDLRTRELRPFAREDRITKIVHVPYRPGARSRAWERIVSDAACDDASLTTFLQRWFGYCTTGSTREQKMAVLWGTGGNAKSLIVSSISRVLGEYSGTAAEGLVVGKGTALHSSATTALIGKRLVTAHESEEGGVLAEGFVKKATGEDKMDARFLYAEQLEFMPTHKLQLLTNHKPTIRGQDRGIWRRVLLVPFLASFGSPEEVERGEAKRVGDPLLGEYFKREEEQEAILAWLVEGAGQWYVHGLNVPAVVKASTETYRDEQDRVGQFVHEMCELGLDYYVPLSDVGMRRGIYAVFVQWCKEAGIFPISKNRFMKELERVVPGFAVKEGRTSTAEGRQKFSRCYGLRLTDEA